MSVLNAQDKSYLAAFLKKLKAAKGYTAAQKQAIWKQQIAKVSTLRSQAIARANQRGGAAMPLKSAKPPPPKSPPQQSTVQQIEGTAKQIVGNPIVKGGLDAIGSAFGDPTLGEEVAGAVNTGISILNTAGSIIGDLGSVFSDDHRAEAQQVAEHSFDTKGPAIDVDTGTVIATHKALAKPPVEVPEDPPEERGRNLRFKNN